MKIPSFQMLAVLASAWLAASDPSAHGLELKTAVDGIAIDAGSFGEFKLTYPALRDAAQTPVHKLIEAKPSGRNAALKYEDGAEIAVTLSGEGEITLQFLKLPAGVKSCTLSMLIDIGFSQGGTWKAGDKTGAFPRSKPAKPHLFQGNTTAFQFTNNQAQSLAFQLPEYSYQELTDNREWNWGIYAWRFIVPLDPGRTQAKIVVSAAANPAGPAVKLVDSFGQATREEWPDKVKSLDELKADVDRENSYYASLKPPPRDPFGGLPGSGERLGLRKTSFFHVEHKGDKWWLVDPAGNAFFHLGVCAFNPSDDYTYIKGRENIYEWLPPYEGPFKSAFRPGDGGANFSFHLANTIRKFGRPYDQEEYAARMIERVRQWGFNSMGAFSAIPKHDGRAPAFPYVAHLPIDEWEGVPRIPGVHETIDPFDEKTRARIQENIAKGVPAHAGDPYLIGWFIVNEPRYDELPKVLPSLPGSQACKRRFVEMMRGKYATIEAFNTAWGAQAKDFDELIQSGLAVKTKTASQDIETFTQQFLEAYFEFISSAYRKSDPNHLLLGCRLQPVTIDNQPLCRISGKYLDIVSYNYYTFGVDKAALKRLHEWSGGRPMILSEFFWASPHDSGLAGGREVSSQQERGLAYRNYVEQSASLGFVLGIEWFTLVDQSVTGRWFSKYSGESANTGLIAVTDRPWKVMLAEMMKTNYGIYDLLLGEKEPFAWEDARFRVRP